MNKTHVPSRITSRNKNIQLLIINTFIVNNMLPKFNHFGSFCTTTVWIMILFHIELFFSFQHSYYLLHPLHSFIREYNLWLLFESIDGEFYYIGTINDKFGIWWFITSIYVIWVAKFGQTRHIWHQGRLLPSAII